MIYSDERRQRTARSQFGPRFVNSLFIRQILLTKFVAPWIILVVRKRWRSVWYEISDNDIICVCLVYKVLFLWSPVLLMVIFTFVALYIPLFTSLDNLFSSLEYIQQVKSCVSFNFNNHSYVRVIGNILHSINSS